MPPRVFFCFCLLYFIFLHFFSLSLISSLSVYFYARIFTYFFWYVLTEIIFVILISLFKLAISFFVSSNIPIFLPTHFSPLIILSYLVLVWFLLLIPFYLNFTLKMQLYLPATCLIIITLTYFTLLFFFSFIYSFFFFVMCLVSNISNFHLQLCISV